MRKLSCTVSCPPCYFAVRLTAVKSLQHLHNGAWRSPVARLVWDQEVPGSNPGAPIQRREQWAPAHCSRL